MDNSYRSFLVRVTARRTPSNEVETDAWFDPEDFASFLRDRFVVAEDAPYGLDAYNKYAGQLIIGVELADKPNPELYIIKCTHCGRVIHFDAAGNWRDSVGLSRCDETDGNHVP